MKHNSEIFKFLFMAIGIALGSMLILPVGPSSATAPVNERKLDTVPPSEEVFVPAGEFVRGCTDDVNNGKCDGDAKPLNLIYLDAFYIDKTEVTNAQYKACVDAGSCLPPLKSNSDTRSFYYGNPDYADYPVMNVDWNRAAAYCRWIDKRLPTEAEWEKAARGTDHRVYPWGNTEPTCSILNFARIDADGKFIPCVGDTTPVGSYPQNASPYGALDMTGNVREWVNDLYESRYYHDAPHYNPQGPSYTSKNEHLVRGGSWADHKLVGCNVWVRIDEADIYQSHVIGFRCARSAAGSPPPAPTPTPIPTPLSRTVGPEGGLVWQAYPDHLTVVHVPQGALNANTSLTITYDTRSDNQEELQGIDHFFSFDAKGPGGTPATFNTPLDLYLGFGKTPGIVADSIELYRLQANSWVTSNITITEQSAKHFTAAINQPGVYSIMGRTNRFYLPTIQKLR